ncbi:M48 family metallopeptidase [Geomonas sp. RF6]|uniref:M48 family metallopeptidase n=1 Tax=Geomonas sp. RF6 TaxID=2897342 RepID=UPI001E604823|nr:M48 family metallopeptidase [Geomonas sp. RF6]UFS72779.1 M48 family metallopeptidase [Geomonas sp. RF6]
MKGVLITLFLLRFAATFLLRELNLRHLRKHGATIPKVFAGQVDGEALAKASRYTVEQSRLGLVEAVFDSALLLLFLFTPLLPLYDRWIASLSPSFVVQGILFMLVLTLAQTVLEIPFSLYGTFQIERRYGFNTMTPRLWIADFIKSLLISALLLAIMVGGALLLVQHWPNLWWLVVWLFFFAFTITMMYLFPYIIEPLFSKVEPLKDAELDAEIHALVEKAGLRVKAVLQKDASRRTLHSNAYFTGIGRTKRIVLYDTLLKQMDRNEILAILAHEVGHWKKGHLLKRLVLTEVGALAALYLSYRLLAWGGLPPLFGLSDASFVAQFLMVGFLGSLAGFPITPLSSWLSRRDEWEADRYAVELSGLPGALASSLVKLSRENLSNLHPHPLYAAFYYSHPPVVQRVEKLLEQTGVPGRETAH